MGHGNLTGTARALPGRTDFLGLVTDNDWQPVRTYPDTSGTDGDGCEVTVSVMRMPAMFWRITAPELGIDLATGSGEGMADLADAIATAISGGMLGLAGTS